MFEHEHFHRLGRNDLKIVKTAKSHNSHIGLHEWLKVNPWAALETPGKGRCKEIPAQTP